MSFIFEEHFSRFFFTPTIYVERVESECEECGTAEAHGLFLSWLCFTVGIIWN
jgi:hypothetical protein